MTFDEFSSLADERVFLSAEELDRFAPTCCALANGAGGWIALGVTPKEDGLPSGVDDFVSLEKQLTDYLQENHPEDAGLVAHFRALPVIDSGGKKILAARVEPAGWRLRPVCIGGNKRSYLRIDGENVISSRVVRWRMALDALETSRDDVPVSGLAMSELDDGSVASFRNKIAAAFPKWEALSMENFLKRALVLNERGGVTRAGELLLGKSSNKIRLSLQDTNETRIIPNLWSACELLPQLSDTLTDACAKAVRECFVNAMLHSEHDAGVINVEFGNEAVVFSNPGLPRSMAQGKSEARNYRLMRIFIMAGLAKGAGDGFDIIRAYDMNFRLRCDMLHLATVSELPLPAEAEFYRTIFPTPDCLPAAQESPVTLPDTPGMPEEEPVETSSTEFEKLPEYDSSADESDASPLVQTVRATPRMSPVVVRDAILELCAEYKSLPELASALARSEKSLRRHYITSMVKEELLEMEFPDRVSHPDQRYRGKRQVR